MNHQSRAALHLLVFLTAFYTLFSSFRIDSGDGMAMYKVADSLITGRGGAISVQPRTADSFGPWGQVQPLALFQGGDGYGLWGADGRYYAKYGIGWSAVAAPMLAVARAGSRMLPGIEADYASQAAMVWLNAFITASTGVLLFGLLAEFQTPALSATLAVLYGLGTFAFYYARSAFGEPLATMLLLAALVAVSRQQFLLAGFSLGGMLLTRQTAILLALPVASWAIIRAYRENTTQVLSRCVTLLGPLVLGQVGVWIYNAYRFGDWWEYGYVSVTWDTPVLLGLYGQLLGPGKGLFVYAPVLLTGFLGWPALFRRHKPWAVLTMTLVASWLLAHSLYSDWSGGGGWGPRLLLPIVPLCFLPAGETFARWNRQVVGRFAIALLVVLSLLSQGLGISVNWARHLQRVFDSSLTPAEYFQRVHFNWADSPLLGQLRSIQEEATLLRASTTCDALNSLVASAQKSNPTAWQGEAVALLSFNVPDFWFVYFHILRILPLRGILLLIACLAGIAGISAWRLRNAILHHRLQ